MSWGLLGKEQEEDEDEEEHWQVRTTHRRSAARYLALRDEESSPARQARLAAAAVVLHDERGWMRRRRGGRTGWPSSTPPWHTARTSDNTHAIVFATTTSRSRGAYACTIGFERPDVLSVFNNFAPIFVATQESMVNLV
jgi:hypothetical protein